MVDDQSLCTKTNRKGERSLETPQSISFFSPQAFEEGYQGRTKNTEERTNNNEDQLNTLYSCPRSTKSFNLIHFNISSTLSINQSCYPNGMPRIYISQNGRSVASKAGQIQRQTVVYLLHSIFPPFFQIFFLILWCQVFNVLSLYFLL